MLRHLPNLICLVRIALVVPVVNALVAGRYELALVLFGVAAISDGLDGFLAKRFNWTSRLGKILDPLADKLLLVAVFVTASWGNLVPWWVAALAIARDLVIGGGALIFRLWFGPLDGRPTLLSKINTGAQILCLLAAILFAAEGLPPAEVVAALAVAAAITTLASGVDYTAAFVRRAWAITAQRG
jgi:cardiolipin synthase (CMP-forming)